MKLRIQTTFLFMIVKVIFLLVISMHSFSEITKEKIIAWLFHGYIQANMANNNGITHEIAIQKFELYADVIFETFEILSNQGILEDELKQMAIKISKRDHRYSLEQLWYSRDLSYLY